eukprot:gnl/Hemi2/10498_TR3628_c0_g1_i1.p1 gnl/Hemi2/10498_TR3628_c0_g1~~gnl/Hemi2/10498_TR3628_c0_g1_i1.p1  ORF type:complete len:483 (+),score=44.56 gnl/Hemi2/10498_TR3628_c0_g1_i1:83-1450(+)
MAEEPQAEGATTPPRQPGGDRSGWVPTPFAGLVIRGPGWKKPLQKDGSQLGDDPDQLLALDPLDREGQRSSSPDLIEAAPGNLETLPTEKAFLPPPPPRPPSDFMASASSDTDADSAASANAALASGNTQKLAEKLIGAIPVIGVQQPPALASSSSSSKIETLPEQRSPSPHSPRSPRSPRVDRDCASPEGDLDHSNSDRASRRTNRKAPSKQKAEFEQVDVPILPEGTPADVELTGNNSAFVSVGLTPKRIPWSTNQTYCLKFDSKHIAIGSDNKIKLGFVTGKRIRKYDAHKAAILSVLLKDNQLITASRDKTIKIWSLDNGNCNNKLEGHTGAVHCIGYDMAPRIVSGSVDCTMKVWDLNRSDCLENRQLVGPARCMHCSVNRLMIGGDSGLMEVWDPRQLRCTQSFSLPEENRTAIHCVDNVGFRVLCGMGSGLVGEWDVRMLASHVKLFK